MDGDGIEKKVKRERKMEWKKIWDFMIKNEEGVIGIEREEIELWEENGINKREEEKRVERKIKREEKELRIKRSYDRRIVENIVERSFVGDLKREGLRVEGWRGKMIKKGEEMRGGVIEKMRKRFKVVERKKWRKKKILREGIVFKVMIKSCGVINIRRNDVLERLKWFNDKKSRW